MAKAVFVIVLAMLCLTLVLWKADTSSKRLEDAVRSAKDEIIIELRSASSAASQERAAIGTKVAENGKKLDIILSIATATVNQDFKQN